MHELGPKDGDRAIDWGKTSADYGRYRTGYPASFFHRLSAFDVATPSQRILDLGTGTGVLARALARRGCDVTGVDIAPQQIEEARRLAAREGVNARFEVAPAESTGLPSASFDLIAASQSWLYFDRERVIPEVQRLLAPGGRLLTCHICWLPRRDLVAYTTEELVLKHNPDWSASDCSGEIPPMPAWAVGRFELAGMFWYDERIPFSRESWRGRIRACRGVGATLEPEQVAAFDAELAKILEVLTDSEDFEVLHRIDAHLFAPWTPPVSPPAPPDPLSSTQNSPGRVAPPS